MLTYCFAALVHETMPVIVAVANYFKLILDSFYKF